MTVLFMDLRQFTTLSHSLPPETLVALLNRYRAIMSDVVFAHDGVIVQFAGDAIEAFWNAPMDQPDHARRACQAALDMSLALGAIRPEFEARGWDHVDLGIGINTGRMVVGNFGSRRRLEYAVVGDPVNVAARLEGPHQALRRARRRRGRHAGGGGRGVCLALLGSRRGEGPARRPSMSGRSVERAERIDAWMRERLARYEEGVDLYRSRRFDEAEKRFAELAQEAPGRWAGGALPRAEPARARAAAPGRLGRRARRADQVALSSTRRGGAPRRGPSRWPPAPRHPTCAAPSKLASITRAVFGSLPFRSWVIRVKSRSP
jgi:adenylate cyclase